MYFAQMYSFLIDSSKWIQYIHLNSYFLNLALAYISSVLILNVAIVYTL